MHAPHTSHHGRLLLACYMQLFSPRPISAHPITPLMDLGHFRVHGCTPQERRSGHPPPCASSHFATGAKLTISRIMIVSMHRSLRLNSLHSDPYPWLSNRNRSWSHATTRPDGEDCINCNSSKMPSASAPMWSLSWVKT
jgi:hypothetical protein